MDLNWVDDVLSGIDRDEGEDGWGWWETSEGAEFGARKLAELKAEIERRYGLLEERARAHGITSWAGAPWAEERAW